MSMRLMTAACLCFVFDAGTGELHESGRGLQVDIEEIDGAVAINGLPMSVSRATGTDVPLLADRLVDRWRIESGAASVRIILCCGWNVASRLHAGASEVIQWRSSHGGELLKSTANLGATARVVPAPRLPLIAECDWSTPVHGRVAQRLFLQVAARCNVAASRALDLAARKLANDGWHWQRGGARVLRAERGGIQAELIAGPLPNGPRERAAEASSLVLIESQSAETARR